MFIFFFFLSRRDIPVTNYRSHTLHCARNVTKCSDCDEIIQREDLDVHIQLVHSIQNCDLCGIDIEAKKLHDHRVS